MSGPHPSCFASHFTSPSIRRDVPHGLLPSAGLARRKMGDSKEKRVQLLFILLFLGTGKQTVATPGMPAVECIVFNDDYLTCEWGNRLEPEANYSFYYWYEDHQHQVKECEHYLQNNMRNIGCRFGSYRPFILFHVHLNDSRGEGSFLKSSMHLNNRVKPDPPFNITFQNLSQNSLTLTWSTRYHIPKCLVHAVKYRSNKDTDWVLLSTQVSGLEANIASVDPKKLYAFTVRSKISESCATTDLWSEWASPAFWGQNASQGSTDGAEMMSFWIQSVLIPISSFLLLLLLLIVLMRMERVWLVLLPKIPNPSKKFEELFSDYQGNFSEWAGVSKEAVESFKPNYHESICLVTELLPGGGYLPMCNSAPPGKGSAHPGPLDSPD
uniref:Fibronectin type-III domain-containing protein n=1 Tax=Salvator merianae TaxID=96440 RepID=A0A8D0DHN1_SALMN